jgi:hypothetical protein
MFHVMLDTSVWLDLAENQKLTPLLDPLTNLMSHGHMTVVVPQLVRDEFAKNRKRVAERAQRSLSSHFNVVRDAIRKVEGDGRQKDKVLAYLGDIDHRIPLVGGVATNTLDRIEKILNAATPLVASDEVMLRAATRALQRKAPCHHENKNSMADAVLVELYFECVRKGKSKDRFAFVTHNKNDFSDTAKNHKLPHPDLAEGFTKIKSLYFTTLSECFGRIDAQFVREVMFEYSYEQEIRSLSEVLEAMDRLTSQVWYNRHKNLAWHIKNGDQKVVPDPVWQANVEKLGWRYNQNHMPESVWEGAKRAAKDAERKLGRGNYGPWDDFEWGMINGKLSALRWVLGEEWDMLDT